jgi:hypothetical protein
LKTVLNLCSDNPIAATVTISKRSEPTGPLRRAGAKQVFVVERWYDKPLEHSRPQPDSSHKPLPLRKMRRVLQQVPEAMAFNRFVPFRSHEGVGGRAEFLYFVRGDRLPDVWCNLFRYPLDRMGRF